jgi:polar amino acid transport system substrate-binding protein
MMTRLIPSLLLLLLAGSGWAGERDVLVIGAFEYPPIYQDANPPGLACDLVLAAFRASGIQAKLEFLPVLRMIDYVAQGTLPCAIGGDVLFDGEAIRPRVLVSDPFMYVVQVFLYDSRIHARGITFDALDDMRPYRIGVLNGSGVMRYLSEPGTLTLDKNHSHQGSARQLHRRRIDVWGIVDLTGMLFIRRLFPEEQAFYACSAPFKRGDISLAVSRKADPGMHYLRSFQQGLAIIKTNGTYMDIMARYYGGTDQINPQALSDDMQNPLP